MSMKSIILRSGDLELELCPSIGGAISRLEWRGSPVLRGCSGTLEDPLEAACFPLVPFVNRVRGGCFTFRGREVRLSPNMKGDPSPLHGQGWRNSWRVEEDSESQAVLRFTHQPGEWAWEYEAMQRFELDDRGLSLRLDCRNLSQEPMPCGLGLHPYFHCGPGTRIDTKVMHAWTIDENVLPVEKVPAEGRFDLSDRLVCGQDLDHGFGGWSGSARMTDPDWPVDVALSSPGARFFQLYSPTSAPIFVAEPVTHANAALSEAEEKWEDLGLRVLGPGEGMSLDMRIDVQPK